jgi:hypothetical protein
MDDIEAVFVTGTEIERELHERRVGQSTVL